jgi:hypothetical protein
MEFVLDGYCGLYCAACPTMLGTKAGTEVNVCHGCKSEQVAPCCAGCGIRACAREKGYEFCHECADLAACDKMRTFMADQDWPYHQGVLKNLETIRLEGKRAWLELQTMRWRCAGCGAAHSWWDETCGQCGQPVQSYKVDL